VSDGDLEARAAVPAVADRDLERLIATFNGMLESLGEYRERLRELARRSLSAAEAERKRVARELHDETAQALAGLLVRLRRLRGRAGPGAGAGDAAVEEMREQVAAALEGVRRSIRALRPPALDELGLVPALESHARSVAETHDLEVLVETDPHTPALPTHAELALYRIAQEALANVVRHAGARTVRVRIERVADEVRLSISDDGLGLRARDAGSSGVGLQGMRERAANLGGRLEVRGEPGCGTTVTARVPAVLDTAAEQPPQSPSDLGGLRDDDG
jgi:two-component system sensor histidine kinase UhpB